MGQSYTILSSDVSAVSCGNSNSRAEIAMIVGQSLCFLVHVHLLKEKIVQCARTIQQHEERVVIAFGHFFRGSNATNPFLSHLQAATYFYTLLFVQGYLATMPEHNISSPQSLEELRE